MRVLAAVPLGAGGTCHGAGGRWRGLAGLRADAPSGARGAGGSRAGRRPLVHTVAGPYGTRNTCGTTQQHRRWAAAHRHTKQPGPTARYDGAPNRSSARKTRWPRSKARIQAERPASSVARWTPPRPASCAAWVRHEKPSARYTASGFAERDGSSEWDATATDRS